MNALTRTAATLAALLSMVFAGTLLAQTPSTAGKTVITVTTVGKKDAPPPAVSKDDIQLTVSKERKQVGSWEKTDSLTLAILIDETLDSSVASQWNELKEFIMAQSPNTSVAVAYASNSQAKIAQDFTTDHALAAKALRIPLGRPTAGSSPYLAVLDWLKRWPDASNGARSLILVSSGIDYFRGSWGPFYPDVDSVVARAQRQNVNLWSIYSPSAFHRSRSFGLVNLGQNNLSKMTDETGGETYYLGTGAPVSFKPYLDEIQLHLRNQYLLAFAGDGGPKGKLVRIQIKSELPDVEFSHADNAFLRSSK
jgi:hypothetical protein